MQRHSLPRHGGGTLSRDEIMVQNGFLLGVEVAADVSQFHLYSAGERSTAMYTHSYKSEAYRGRGNFVDSAFNMMVVREASVLISLPAPPSRCAMSVYE